MRRRLGVEINVVSVSFVDLLTTMVGCLIFILAYVIYAQGHQSKESLRDIEIVSQAVPPIFAGSKFKFAFSARGGLEPYSWSIRGHDGCSGGGRNSVPKGVSIDRNTGELSAFDGVDVVAADAFGRYCVQVEVNALGKSAEISTVTGSREPYLKAKKAFQLVLTPPLGDYTSRLNATTLPDATVGVEYSYDFVAVGPPPQKVGVISAKYVGDAGKASLRASDDAAIDSEAITISGTRLTWKSPSRVGRARIELAAPALPVQENVGEPRVWNFDIFVRDRQVPYRRPKILKDEMAEAHRFLPYSFRLTVEGGIPPYRWSASGLPEGLTVDSQTGVVTGTPGVGTTAMGNSKVYTISVAVDDASRGSDEAELKLQVGERFVAVKRLRVTTAQAQLDGAVAVEKKPFSFQFAAEGGESTKYAWGITSVPPLGVKHSDTGGELSFTPVKAGKYHLTARVTDGVDSDVGEFDLVVSSPPPIPPRIVITPSASAVGLVGDKILISATGEGGDLPYSWSLDPSGGVFQLAVDKKDPRKARVVGTPERSGRVALNLALGDSRGARSSEALIIDVRERVAIDPDKILPGISERQYVIDINPKGGFPPYTVKLSGAPDWLISGQRQEVSVQDKGAAQWKGAAARGQHDLTVSVEDSRRNRADKTYKLVVTDPGSTPVPPSDDDVVIGVGPERGGLGVGEGDCSNRASVCVLQEGASYNQYRAVLSTSGKGLALREGRVPGGLGISVESGGSLVISGSPTESGRFYFVVGGFEGEPGTQKFRIDVLSTMEMVKGALTHLFWPIVYYFY